MITVAQNMQAYFREALVSAMRQSQLSFTDAAQVYVVLLLNEFSRAEKVYTGHLASDHLTMAHMFERAFLADDHEALQIFRHLGDSSLYLLGFFRASQEGGLVSVSHYMDMGAASYAHASDRARAYAFSSAALFQELSHRFADLVTVVDLIERYGNIQNKT